MMNFCKVMRDNRILSACFIDSNFCFDDQFSKKIFSWLQSVFKNVAIAQLEIKGNETFAMRCREKVVVVYLSVHLYLCSVYYHFTCLPCCVTMFCYVITIMPSLICVPYLVLS